MRDVQHIQVAFIPNKYNAPQHPLTNPTQHQTPRNEEAMNWGWGQNEFYGPPFAIMGGRLGLSQVPPAEGTPGIKWV